MFQLCACTFNGTHTHTHIYILWLHISEQPTTTMTAATTRTSTTTKIEVNICLFILSDYQKPKHWLCIFVKLFCCLIFVEASEQERDRVIFRVQKQWNLIINFCTWKWYWVLLNFKMSNDIKWKIKWKLCIEWWFNWMHDWNWYTPHSVTITTLWFIYDAILLSPLHHRWISIPLHVIID